MHNSPFTVGGMSTSTGAHHHSPNINTRSTNSTGGPLTAPFSDTLSQSRSHYQPGYLMSASQNNVCAPANLARERPLLTDSTIKNVPQGSQRVDEVPIVQTKAKMNQILSRGSTSDFGMDSMFESTRRKRQNLTDEDAPPTRSINDIPNEMKFDSTSPVRFQLRNSTLDNSVFPRRQQRATAPSTPQQPAQPLYIIVFGYPVEKYSVTVEFFQSLGVATEPDPNVEIQNCFRIGYYNPGDALRAVRKNGEVLGGSWMIGTKWADPAQAEALLGQNLLSTTFTGQVSDSNSQSNAMAIDEPSSPPVHGISGTNTPSVGTPIKLAPSSSAFRRNVETVSTPQPQRGWGPKLPGTAAGSQTNNPVLPPTTSSPNKGVLGQVSDLIFGW